MKNVLRSININFPFLFRVLLCFLSFVVALSKDLLKLENCEVKHTVRRDIMKESENSEVEEAGVREKIN